MPPSRRRPTPQPQPSARRPRVAGLRRPAGPAKPDTETTEVAEATEVTDAVDVAEPVEAVEVEETEPVVAEETVDEVTEDDPDADADEDVVADEADEGEADEEPPAKAERAARPSGKRRSSGLRAPTAKADLAKAERRSRDDRRPAGATKRDGVDQLVRGRLTLAIVLVVIALVLAGLTLFFRIQAVNAGDAADTGNAAVTDSEGTKQLLGELRPPVEAVFSIDYQHLDKTAAAAKANLTGDAQKQYEKLFGVVRDNAPKEKLVSTFKIREMSVMSLRGDSAEVLVFADQTSNRPCDPRDDKVRTCAAAIGVPAQRVDGHWKIAGFDMFNAAPTG